ncbi:ABC transporter ATP-binding protein [Alginatibacterium sediminis]|uniref:ABC transporter ATP-binding protein n=1 Tax=Alginatibacterium sediminis TaxID=2164068 RepID=A0A420E6B6_9ALTE|nr:ABC transporter ATP-binding protein [Alginatibacterium sediminis]RKF13288.1 ABC transporter ATP-binding protein [Alginatibacterium sediminis]
MTIKIKQLVKTYQAHTDFPVHAVNQVNLDIAQGEFLAIMGPSGSGKTTLLNLLGGIDQPSSGTVTIDGECLQTLSDSALIRFRRDHIGFIFQNYSLLPVFSALENVQFIMQLQGLPDNQCAQRAEQLLSDVGLAAHIHKRPAQLSGGQQQRVAVARALASKPRFILADEPTANLDATNTQELIHIMQDLNQREQTTFIFSTHDPRVITSAKRVINFEDGQISSDIQQ